VFAWRRFRRHDFIGDVAGAAGYAHRDSGDLHPGFDFVQVELDGDLVLRFADDFEHRWSGAEDFVYVALGGFDLVARQIGMEIVQASFEKAFELCVALFGAGGAVQFVELGCRS